jgi:hypothetical protein
MVFSIYQTKNFKDIQLIHILEKTSKSSSFEAETTNKMSTARSIVANGASLAVTGRRSSTTDRVTHQSKHTSNRRTRNTNRNPQSKSPMREFFSSLQQDGKHPNATDSPPSVESVHGKTNTTRLSNRGGKGIHENIKNISTASNHPTTNIGKDCLAADRALSKPVPTHVPPLRSVPFPRTKKKLTNMSQYSHKFQHNNNVLTADRSFGKNNSTTHPSRSRRATSLFQPNKKPAAVPSGAIKGNGKPGLSRSSEKGADGGAVSSNKCTVLDNPNPNPNPIPSIVHHLGNRTIYRLAGASFGSSKMPTAELRMGDALGNKKNSLPLDKTERRKDWKSSKDSDSAAAGYAVSDPVDTTNTASPTSASGNVAIAGDLDDASDLSQNQSKCGCFLFYF